MIATAATHGCDYGTTSASGELPKVNTGDWWDEKAESEDEEPDEMWAWLWTTPIAHELQSTTQAIKHHPNTGRGKPSARVAPASNKEQA